MTSHRLGLLREEYETTDISLDELCVYHNIALKDLKGYKTWRKDASLEVTITQPQPVIEVLPYLPPQTTTPAVDIKQLVTECKELAITKCKDFLVNDAKFAEVKEFKDIVAIVNDIDKSMQASKGVPEGSTVHVYINNLINNFRDDC